MLPRLLKALKGHGPTRGPDADAGPGESGESGLTERTQDRERIGIVYSLLVVSPYGTQRSTHTSMLLSEKTRAPDLLKYVYL